VQAIQADRRTLTFDENYALLDRATSQAEAAREADIALAKTLLEIRRTRAHVAVGCSSVEMYGRRLGYELHEVVRLLKLGDSMAADTSIEDRVRRKAMTVPAAAEIAPVLKAPELFAEKADWVGRAEKERYSRLRRSARERLAEIRCGEAVETVEVRVPDSVLERFEQARVIASRKAGRVLSRDETFEAVVDAYVDANDGLLIKGRARRVGPTADIPGSRYIPIAVRRAIRRRAGDQCEFPECWERARLQFAHRRPHRHGSGREVDDLFLLCWQHHLFMDGHFMVPVGPTGNPAWVCPPTGIVTTRDSPGGRMPETARERRVIAAQKRMEQVRRRRAARESAAAGDDGEEPG
jgi:hypothetical protein